MIHLDTNVLIQAVIPGTPADARLRFWMRRKEALHVSAIVWAEFLCGPLHPDLAALAARLTLSRVPVTEAEATLAADLFNQTGRRRSSLPDCLIAATAMIAGAALATINIADFETMVPHGLTLEPIYA
jgi:predicted nucleic acid-binding protein